MLNLFIADDHNIIISGIRSMLENVADIQVVGEASNGAEAVERISELPTLPDLVLMDIKMPELNGIEATTKLRLKFPDIKVMALTMYDDDEYVTSMLQAGARGYVLKNTGKQELLQAIQVVAGGETYFSEEATQAVMASLMSRSGKAPNGNGAAMVGSNGARTLPAGEDRPEVPLTKREKEILKLISSEMTNAEIAERLFISQRTVHSHRRNLMQKVGVKNTAGLVRYAIKYGIL